MANKAGGLAVVSHPHIGDIFADEAIAFDHRDGTVRVTLATKKMVDPAPPSQLQFVVVNRLVMTVPGAQRMVLALFDYLKQQGLDPAAVVGGGEETPVN
ncbi:hypothetical protein [Sphingomonas sp.]|uniref:hypothetical protein n=1 Tax=Sphingomonas sp. TaxID=28214 RepID=UPI002CC42FE8|nr:hypothetical protein [Sphingomonas sp.]HWK35130.1 hypothetical protein [Sphingomonas sp.]